MGSKTELEEGTVVSYNPKKHTGRIRTPNGEYIFFNLGNGRRVRINKNRTEEFFSREVKIFGKEYSHLPEPQYGDEVIFIRAKGSKGRPTASPWTYLYMQVEAWLDYDRDQMPCHACGHLEYEHSGGECQHPGCHCGNEAYRVAPGMETDGPREVSTGDSLGGFSICQ